MHFSFKSFNELNIRELFSIYELRSEVFVVEQNCPYQDPDEKDLLAYHLMMYDEDVLIAYSRILPPAVSYKEPSIGRVVVKKKYRGQSSGKSLMKYCINKTRELFKDQDIVISAQLYLLDFYKDLGFIPEGDQYHEDNIPHIKMRYNISEASN